MENLSLSSDRKFENKATLFGQYNKFNKSYNNIIQTINKHNKIMSDTVFSLKGEYFKNFYNNIVNEKIKTILKQKTEKTENSYQGNNSTNFKTQNQKNDNIFSANIHSNFSKSTLNFYKHKKFDKYYYNNNKREQDNDYITTSQNNTISPNYKFKPKINNLNHEKYFPRNLSNFTNITNTQKIETIFNFKNSALSSLNSEKSNNNTNNENIMPEKTLFCSLPLLENNEQKLEKISKLKKLQIEVKPTLKNKSLKINKTSDFCVNINKKSINLDYYGETLPIKLPFLYEPSVISKNTSLNKNEKKIHELLLNEFNKLKDYLLRNKENQIFFIKDALNKLKINVEKYNTKKLLFLCNFICQFNGNENKLKPFFSIKEVLVDILENPESYDNNVKINSNSAETKKNFTSKKKKIEKIYSLPLIKIKNLSNMNDINLSINIENIHNNQINRSKTKSKTELIKTNTNKKNNSKEKENLNLTKNTFKKNYKFIIKQIGSEMKKYNNMDIDKEKNIGIGTKLKISNKSVDNEKLQIRKSRSKKYIDSYLCKMQKKIKGRNYNALNNYDFSKKNILYKGKSIKNEGKIEKNNNYSVNKILKSFNYSSLMKKLSLYYVNNN